MQGKKKRQENRTQKNPQVLFIIVKKNNLQFYNNLKLFMFS